MPRLQNLEAARSLQVGCFFLKKQMTQETQRPGPLLHGMERKNRQNRTDLGVVIPHSFPSLTTDLL